MSCLNEHSFHIPVMGTAFSIDTPLKVGKFGVTSVISLCDDELCEQVRAFYSEKYKLTYRPIEKYSDDYRAKRITAYLDLVNVLLKQQIDEIKALPFGELNDLSKYFELLPQDSSLKQRYRTMQECNVADEKKLMQRDLKAEIKPGLIEVNIMTKLDRDAYDKKGHKMEVIYSDALAALRGFAQSNVEGNIVFSAGFNRRLYAYINEFSDFFFDRFGLLKKKIVIKVSDYRSAYTQGKFLAKKGLWVSEYRVESGLNCGGHAFATAGYLLGPILEEFKTKLGTLAKDLYAIYSERIKHMGKVLLKECPSIDFTVQGGIGTHCEHQFLLEYYKTTRNGWGTPFLLVEEVTNLDSSTRRLLAKAGEEDCYLSEISPLGVPFNTVKGTESEKQKLQRIDSGKPGSPCPKGYLVSTFEGTESQENPKPVCKASRFYQMNKIKALKARIFDADKLQVAIKKVVEKVCLCEDLASSFQLVKNIDFKRPLKTAVCPGPNLAYFSKLSTFSEMVGHIYGRLNLRNQQYRSNLFINELKLYIHYFQREVTRVLSDQTPDISYLDSFQANLFDGIDYYMKLIPNFIQEGKKYQQFMKRDLDNLRCHLQEFVSKYSFLTPHTSCLSL
ncbi:MAG: hypothetical protein VW378_03730 [bacterium]